MRRPRSVWSLAAVAALSSSGGLVLTLGSKAMAACTLLWGHSPTLECLWHAEFAKEGLAVDTSERSYSVGYGQSGGSSATKEAVLQVRDSAGGFLGRGIYANGTFDALYAGVWVPNAGAAAYAVGTHYTGNAANPTQLILTRWLPGGGTPWSSPVNSLTVAYAPSALGLFGIEAWGCRVIKAGTTDLFVSGCSEFEIFLVRVDRATLSLVTSWGVGGVQSIGSFNPGGCPRHEVPGGFVDFKNYPQSFVETNPFATTVYVGGTLLDDLPGFPVDYDYVVGAYAAASGAPALPFGVQYSRYVGDDYMKALSVTQGGVYAVGTVDPTNNPQMLLVPWHSSGALRPPFYVSEPTPSRGNDVETRLSSQGTEIYVGGYGNTGGNNGAVWHFTHQAPFSSPVTLPALWNGGGTGPNPKQYGLIPAVTDEVYDLGLGKGAFAGHVFAAGGLMISPGNWGQNLLCIAPTGVAMHSNNASPLAPGDDRSNAVLYDSAAGGTLFTHGTCLDPGGTWLACPIHWAYRSSRYKP
jgi:hypothetical protein